MNNKQKFEFSKADNKDKRKQNWNARWTHNNNDPKKYRKKMGKKHVNTSNENKKNIKTMAKAILNIHQKGSERDREWRERKKW